MALFDPVISQTEFAFGESDGNSETVRVKNVNRLAVPNGDAISVLLNRL